MSSGNSAQAFSDNESSSSSMDRQEAFHDNLFDRLRSRRLQISRKCDSYKQQHCTPKLQRLAKPSAIRVSANSDGIAASFQPPRLSPLSFFSSSQILPIDSQNSGDAKDPKRNTESRGKGVLLMPVPKQLGPSWNRAPSSAFEPVTSKPFTDKILNSTNQENTDSPERSSLRQKSCDCLVIHNYSNRMDLDGVEISFHENCTTPSSFSPTSPG